MKDILIIMNEMSLRPTTKKAIAEIVEASEKLEHDKGRAIQAREEREFRLEKYDLRPPRIIKEPRANWQSEYTRKFGGRK